MSHDIKDLFDAIDWAESLIVTRMEAVGLVRESRRDDPSAFPGYFVETTDAALARTILGDLLAAGWTAPGEAQWPT